MTGSEIFEAALQEIGVLAAGEVPSAADAELLRRKFNRMVGTWNTQRRFVVYEKHQQFTFGTSQQSYTIGPTGADFTSDRPLRLERVKLVLTASTPDVDLPLENLQVGEYADLSVPTLSSTIPTKIYYEPTFPSGTIYPWPYPTVTSNKLELWWWTKLSEIAEADVTTEYSLATGYDDALTLSLAEQCLGKIWGVEDDPQLRNRARLARLAISGANSSPLRIATQDTGMPGAGQFNYLTGSVTG